jgi:hypothetical protein
MQITAQKNSIITPSNSAPASRPRFEVRDTIEDYLNPEGSVAKSTTYGQQVSGYAEFLKDAKFRDAVAINGMTDEYFKTLSHDQKVAFSDIRAGLRSDHDRRIYANEAYPPEKGGRFFSGVPQPAEASIGSMFHSELNSGAIDNLKSVDRDEKAGISPNTWADAFRSRVTSLDHHFDQLRRTYEFQGKDTAEITALYEKGLGDLYDYAKARKAETARSG